MAVPTLERIQPGPKVTAAERLAAERLGRVYRAIHDHRGALDEGAVPEFGIGGRGSNQELMPALVEIYNPAKAKSYGFDSARARFYGLPAYPSPAVLYTADYNLVMPKLRAAIRDWTEGALKAEDLALGHLEYRLAREPGLTERLQQAAQEVMRKAGVLDATADETRKAQVTKEDPVMTVNKSQLEKIVRSRLAPAVREVNAEMKDWVLATLFAHPQGIAILRAYSEGPKVDLPAMVSGADYKRSEGPDLAIRLVQEARRAITDFRGELELTSTAGRAPFWKYPMLVCGGLSQLGLLDVPDFKEYSVGIGQVRGRGVVERLVGFGGVAVLCLMVFFTGPLGVAVLGVADLALAGTATGLAYVREREQELGFKASGFRGETERFAADPGYVDTLFAGAAAFLSGIACFRALKDVRDAQKLESLVKAEAKTVSEAVGPRGSKASPSAPGRPAEVPRTDPGASGVSQPVQPPAAAPKGESPVVKPADRKNLPSDRNPEPPAITPPKEEPPAITPEERKNLPSDRNPGPLQGTKKPKWIQFWHESDLAEKVHQRRLQLMKNGSVDFGENLAAIEYLDPVTNKLEVEFGKSSKELKIHAERDAIERLKAKLKDKFSYQSIQRLYTERIPCTQPEHNCSKLIADTLGHAQIEYSYDGLSHQGKYITADQQLLSDYYPWFTKDGRPKLFRGEQPP